MNRNSALIWFPKIREAKLPVPKTVFIPYNHRLLSAFLEDGSGPGGKAELDSVVADVAGACHAIGFPCFLRTDLAAAKHDGPSSYLIGSDGEILKRIAATIFDNEMKFWPETQPEALMVRRFLDLDSRFVAFGGFPVSREFRFFADSKSVLCYHPYWPEEAIKFYGVQEPEGWQTGLRELCIITDDDVRALKEMAIRAAIVCGGEPWSVDFAREKNGKWWLTDMAVAADSYHWEGCENQKLQVHRDLLTGETWTDEKKKP
jgi:hypothetical protein